VTLNESEPVLDASSEALTECSPIVESRCLIWIPSMTRHFVTIHEPFFTATVDVIRYSDFILAFLSGSSTSSIPFSVIVNLTEPYS
jgi:hypothetical protein